MPETQVNIHEAKTHLSKLLDRAAAGEEIVIARHGRPIARLTAIPARREPRKLGLLKDQIWIADDFDGPLPPDLAQAFGMEVEQPDSPDPSDVPSNQAATRRGKQ